MLGQDRSHPFACAVSSSPALLATAIGLLALLGLDRASATCRRASGPARAPAGPTGSDERLREQQRELALEHMDRQRVPGVAMALIRSGELAWFGGVGWADEAGEHRFTLDTVCSIGSISKCVAAFGPMRLVESGALDLDAPVDDMLRSWSVPRSRFDERGVTLARAALDALRSQTEGPTGLVALGAAADVLPVVARDARQVAFTIALAPPVPRGLSRQRAPGLWLVGERDVLHDAQAIRRAVEGAGGEQLECEAWPDANHALHRAHTGAVAEDGLLRGYDPRLFDRVRGWAAAHRGSRGAACARGRRCSIRRRELGGERRTAALGPPRAGCRAARRSRNRPRSRARGAGSAGRSS